jgi:hypothetical protein
MEVGMAADVQKAAKEFIDSALAARARLGYSAKVSKKSYGRAVDQATHVFERFARDDRPEVARPRRGSGGR